MIVIIDNYDSFTYNLYQAVAVQGCDVRVFRNDSIDIASLLALQPSGIILSPGPGRPEDAGICVALIQALPKDLPLLGVCLGLQAIAYAFGGYIIHAPLVMHGKTTYVFHHRKGLYQDLCLPFQAGRYHSLIVDRARLPDSLHVESETADGLIMGLCHKTQPIFGVQFHPESILTPMGPKLIQQFVDLCEMQIGALCA